MSAFDRLSNSPAAQRLGLNNAATNGTGAQRARLGAESLTQRSGAQETATAGLAAEGNKRAGLEPPAHFRASQARVFADANAELRGSRGHEPPAQLASGTLSVGAAAEQNKRPGAEPPGHSHHSQTSVFADANAELRGRRGHEPPAQLASGTLSVGAAAEQNKRQGAEPPGRSAASQASVFAQATAALARTETPQPSAQPTVLPEKASSETPVVVKSRVPLKPILKRPSEQRTAFAEISTNVGTDVRRNQTTTRRGSPSPTAIDVLVSVRDNKIGSIYSSTGRIRTTHGQGPAKESHGSENILRFNINYAEAKKAFALDAAKEIRKAQSSIPWHLPKQRKEEAKERIFVNLSHSWIAAALKVSEVTPSWASKVTGPGDVRHIDDVEKDTDQHLFEIYTHKSGRTKQTHISRGEAAYISIEKSTLDKIEKALEQIDPKWTAYNKNRAFYDYLQEHAPEIADKIRQS